mmetsp:Transcript_74727/g.215916  ORF Transcript_74727/g.215916 Transcript_74727/m.215916 type:complete len:135 (+) Transcript_74727:384-788(+)
MALMCAPVPEAAAPLPPSPPLLPPPELEGEARPEDKASALSSAASDSEGAAVAAVEHLDDDAVDGAGAAAVHANEAEGDAVPACRGGRLRGVIIRGIPLPTLCVGGATPSGRLVVPPLAARAPSRLPTAPAAAE